MTDLNKVTLIGRLTRDVETSYISNATAKASFSIAVGRSYKKGDEWQNETSYIDCTLWGKQAESLKPYLLKGKQVAIEGHLKQERWEKDGQKFSKLAVVVESVYLLGSKDNGSSENNAEAAAQAIADAFGGEFVEEKIPF